MKKIYFAVSFCFLLSGLTTYGQKSTKTKAIKNNYVSVQKTLEKSSKKIKPKSAVLWEEDFSDGGTSWSMDNESDYDGDWVVGTNGPTGGYSEGMGSIESTTAGNNFALFDSDALCPSDCQQNAWMQTNSPLDFSNYEGVVVSFESYYRDYYGSCFLELSTDMTNWVTYEVHQDIGVNELSDNPELITVNVSNDFGGEPEVYLRYRYEGGWAYAWMIDDIVVAEAFEYNLNLSNVSWSMGYEGLNYGTIPVAQLSTIFFDAQVINEGTQNQTNVVVDLDINGEGVSSPEQTILSDETLNFNVGTYDAPQEVAGYTVKASVSSPNEEENPDNNVINNAAAFDVSNYIYARDKGASNYTGGGVSVQGNGYDVGNTFEILSTQQLKAIDVYIRDDAPVGEEIYGTLYDLSFGEFDYLVETDLYTIQESDLGKFITLPFISPVTVEEGGLYVPTIGTYGGGFVTGVSGASDPQTTFLYSHSDATWYFTTSTVMVRMNFDPCINSSIDATATTTDASCNGVADGSILVEGNGGNEPYEYTWSHDEELEGNLAENLLAGDYEVMVTDKYQCEEVVKTYTVNEPAIFTLNSTVTDVTDCGLSDGSIDLTLSDIKIEEDHTYSWTNQSGTVTGGPEVINYPDVDGTITDLPVGLYTVTVTDNEGCEINRDVQVNEAGAAEIEEETVVGESCLDAADGSIGIGSNNNISTYTFEWRDEDGTILTGEDGTQVSGLSSGTYTVFGEGDGCTSNTLKIEINKGERLELGLELTSPISCLGKEDAIITATFSNLSEDITDYTFTWNDGTTDLAETSSQVTDLGPGTYNVAAEGLCTSNNPSVIVDPVENPVDLSLVYNPISCNGEETTMSLSSSYDLTEFTFEWSFNGSSINSETGLSVTGGAGAYEVIGNGECEIETVSETVGEPLEIIIDGDISMDELAQEATISTSGTGGTGSFVYSWEGTNNFEGNESDAVVTENGTYTVTYTDENGCESSEEFVINTISVEKYAKNNIKVYPNPAKTIINFKLNNVEANNIYVYDITGKSVANIDASNGSLIELDVQNLENGMYLFHIVKKDGEIVVSSRFTVAR